MVAAGVQLSTAGYSPVYEHLTTGITYLEKVNPQEAATLSVVPPVIPTDVSERLLARHVAPDHCVLLFPEGSLSVPRGSQ